MGHALIAALGIFDYQPVRYSHPDDRGRTHLTRFAPVATAVLHGGVDEAFVLVTEGARDKHWESLTLELSASGVTAHAVRIPDVRDESELWSLFDAVRRAVPPSSHVVVDITYAFRHLPLTLLAVLTYLSGEGGVHVERIWYGAFEARTRDVAPVWDLTPFLRVVDGYHAVRQLRETGDGRRLAGHLTELNDSLWKKQRGRPAFSRAAGALKRASAALASGLPLEAGLAGRDALTALEDDVPGAAGLNPLTRSLIDAMRPLLEEWACEKGPRKGELALTLPELERQLRVTAFFAEMHAESRALRLLREWVVNRCLLACGQSGPWLARDKGRLPMERRLNALAERTKVDRDRRSTTDAERALAALWQSITTQRNRVAHAGMCPEEVDSQTTSVSDLINTCRDQMADDSVWTPGSARRTDRVLVTPLGLAAGVLYTALLRLQPDVTLVITSAEAAPNIEEVCRRASVERGRVRDFVVADPHRCFTEAGRIGDAALDLLLSAGSATFNVTGGTTAMQYVVDYLSRRADRIGTPVHRVALVDARSYTEQQAEPFVAGEVVPLDSNGEGG
jgi:hypothetical protein